MKKNVLAEVNRVREIMGITLLNEQVDVEDEIIDVEGDDLSNITVWSNPYKGGGKIWDFYSEKEPWSNHYVSIVNPNNKLIGPMGDNLGYLLFEPGEDTINIDGREKELFVAYTERTIGGNMDIPFIEIDNRKSKPVGGNSRYNLNEGARFIGPQKQGFLNQDRDNGIMGIDAIRAIFLEDGGLQKAGNFNLLVYGRITNNYLSVVNFDIALARIDALEVNGDQTGIKKTKGENKGKKGFLSMTNYIPYKKGLAWHLTGQPYLLSHGEPGDIPPPPPPPPPLIITQDFDFRANNPFEFDKAGITDKAKDALAKEMQALFELADGEGDKLQQYVNKYLNGKEVIINAYSSIDADPDEIGGGEYVGSSNCAKRVGGRPTGLRKDYNLCLSQARAEAVAEYLKLEYPDIFGEVIFKPIGHGESNESGNGVFAPYGSDEQKKHADDKRVATRTDRRFQFSLPGASFDDDVIQ